MPGMRCQTGAFSRSRPLASRSLRTGSHGNRVLLPGRMSVWSSGTPVMAWMPKRNSTSLSHSLRRSRTVTKQNSKGTGLGLLSVYGGVEQNHGQIFVASELGKGTTFSIYLPRIESASALESRPPTSDHLPQGNETILLVEDESAVRQMLREVLSKAGYRVWDSETGAKALEQWGAKIEQIDLLVTEIVMPVMNGLKLAEELRNRCPGLKIIFMSGHAGEMTGAMINRQGGSDPAPDLLSKPSRTRTTQIA